jgi:alkylhydroperoxidase/carboxymuconolactone decarboxylase family protein YurZ
LGDAQQQRSDLLLGLLGVCTVAMLACLGQQLQLGVYVRSARRQGATEEEIREVLRQVAVYAGFPSAWNALATMNAALGRSGDSDADGVDL